MDTAAQTIAQPDGRLFIAALIVLIAAVFLFIILPALIVGARYEENVNQNLDVRHKD